MRGFREWLALGGLVLSGSVMADVDRSALAELEARIRSGAIPGVHAVVVVHRGERVAEWYVSGEDRSIFEDYGPVNFTPETLHDVRSVTKSIVGLLVGVAVAEGKLSDLEAPALEAFPEYADIATPERRAIRLGHLLTMTSGFAWDESTYPYSDPRNSEIAMATSADPYRYVFTQPIEARAGERFRYSGGDVEVMAAVLTRATGVPIETYVRDRLFAPLGIERFEWVKNRGTPMAASGLRLAPRDLARIGEMMLEEGRWQDRQVVPAEWIKVATTPHAAVEPDPDCGTRYGYFWWLGVGCEFEPRTPWVAAIGNGGQRLWLVPSRDLVIVSTLGLYDRPEQRAASGAILAGVLRAVGP